MFTNYETSLNNQFWEPAIPMAAPKDPKIITNIKGDILGVQVDHSSPLQLYFHLEDVCDTEVAEILTGTTLFEVLTTTHKVVVSREFLTAEILNQNTIDLSISLSQADMEILKKETYSMRVALKTANAVYEVFAEKDGYLIVR
jgi:hypothetical protein